MSARSANLAESLIRKTGARATTARVNVLGFLLKQPRPFTHHEIAQALGTEKPIDSVTLYRVLDWLTGEELVHRIGGDDQVWHFSAGNAHASQEHAHFQCTKCAAITCFTEIKLPRKISLPAGFHRQEMDFLIKGICPRCN